ncbi:MAG: hypothetical protein ABEJ02_00575 [Candidatus Paceibacteria bacterium]
MCATSSVVFICLQVFGNGYDYNKKVVEERRDCEVEAYLSELRQFIDTNITPTIINQDLNVLLDYDKFKRVKKALNKRSWL